MRMWESPLSVASASRSCCTESAVVTESSRLLCSGIVVGNAQPELLDWLVKQPQTGKTLMADAYFADGIVEGLARHGMY